MILDAKLAAQLLSVEGARTDLEWWTQALELVAEYRDAEDAAPYEALRETLGKIIPEAEGSDVFELCRAELTLAQKLFLLAILSAFAEVCLAAREVSSRRWLNKWEPAAEFLLIAARIVLPDPSQIDADQIEPCWRALRAAAS